jgi:hypothetical protein
MSRKHSAKGEGAKASDRNGNQPDWNAPHGSGLESSRAAHRFRANVFTWTGPGVENIFIDFQPAEQRKDRELWKDGDRDSRGGLSARPVDNVG